MRRKRKAEVCCFGPKPNFTNGEIKASSCFNSITELEHIAFIRPRFIRGRRTVRSFDWKRQKPGRIKAI